ncbi:GNAT family N-acetyltransferase [Corynebacterium sp. HMSC28B08]|uniref:GNAT family N-acetyltransferase n=1 Tax=Corynebacterium sp. HMSC28B08 TaxID=1581066 RepID=UPI00114CEB8A
MTISTPGWKAPSVAAWSPCRQTKLWVCACFPPAGPAPADHPSGGLYTTIQQSDLDAERTMVFGPLAVTPSAAGKRLSGRLIHAVQEESRRLGTSAIVSFVDDANRKSTRLHHNLGFDVLGTFEHKGRPFTAFVLQ